MNVPEVAPRIKGHGLAPPPSCLLQPLPMRVAFLGQSGPYAPPILRHLLLRPRSYEIALVVEGLRGRGLGPEHRLRKPQPAPLPRGGEPLGSRPRRRHPGAADPRRKRRGSRSRIVAVTTIDRLVCAGFDRLFKPALLATARHGGINAHPSLLPELRGPSPIFWALRAGRRQLGVTLHAPRPPRGPRPIYEQRGFSWPELRHRLARSSAPRPRSPVRMLRSCSIGPVRAARGHPHRTKRQATRAPRPQPEDARIEPLEWSCRHVVDFASGAVFFRAVWMRFGEQIFFARRRPAAEVGSPHPGALPLRKARPSWSSARTASPTSRSKCSVGPELGDHVLLDRDLGRALIQSPEGRRRLPR